MSADYVCQILWSYICFKKLHLLKAGVFAWYSIKICIIFGVLSGLKYEKLIKSKPSWKLKHANSIPVFWIFLPNVVKIDLYNFEVYCFKVGAFLRHSIFYCFSCSFWAPSITSSFLACTCTTIECDHCMPFFLIHSVTVIFVLLALEILKHMVLDLCILISLCSN